MREQKPIDPVELVQKIAALLESASFDTTYKLATLEALIRVLCDKLGPTGAPPLMFSAREISDRVLERYWAQTALFEGSSHPNDGVLRQRSGGQSGDLADRIASVRRELGLLMRADSLVFARRVAPERIRELEELVWARIVDMPIPRLQRFGNGANATEDRFLYDYGWSREGEKRHVKLARLDDTITLMPGVGPGLIALHPLLLRHIEGMWAQLVAAWNPNLTDSARLSEALFGGERQGNSALAGPLSELQQGKCFYCGETLGILREVDHFLPWSVTHNDNIENLVMACRACNSRKSAAYAALTHLKAWRSRIASTSPLHDEFASLALQFARRHNPNQSLGQARSLYLFSSHGRPLWVMGDQFVELDMAELQPILAN